MNLQEQEEHDFNFGRATEFQNAFAFNRMNRKPDDTLAIEEAIANNKFVIVIEGPEYCPSTDAFMGTRKNLNSSFSSREEAQTALNSLFPEEVHYDLNIYILPAVAQMQPLPDPWGCDMIPF